ncbi:hypothetical protein MUK42_14287 [Musa troglodytarum]|uniref:Uncharacterized protein n=1 Tax=Musa troglodytarum TaxID=320322 RepID=A0A9E7LA86_9LILI|nr:hypothetical protein MUK42_14287 [Musa troglodytarum]
MMSLLLNNFFSVSKWIFSMESQLVVEAPLLLFKRRDFSSSFLTEQNSIVGGTKSFILLRREHGLWLLWVNIFLPWPRPPHGSGPNTEVAIASRAEADVVEKDHPLTRRLHP